MRLVLALTLGLLLPSIHLAQGASLPKMSLETEWRDGNPQDMATVSVADGGPFQRSWAAQGRRRAVWRVDDRARELNEEDFNYDSPLRDVAIDEDSNLMFTLTLRSQQTLDTGALTYEAIIRVDDIFQPDVTFQVGSDFQPGGLPQRITVSPEQDLLIVTYATELRLFDYSSIATAGFVPRGTATLPPGTSTGCTGTLKTISRTRVAKVDPGTGERYVALVLVSVDESPIACDPNKPSASALVVCDIDDSSLPNPDFYLFPSQIWQPCRTGGECEDWRVNDIDHVRVGSQDLVYAVGGPKVQIRELDITNVATTGITETPPSPLGITDHLIRVHVDPDAPTNSDYLYVIGRHRAHVVDRTTLTHASDHFGYGKGPQGDTPFMVGDGGEREIWSLASVNADYIRRVNDFTQTSDPGLELPTSEGYYTAGPTDGGVALFLWDSVYLPTFAGVVRYDIGGSTPIPIDGSYQPAGLGTQGNTVEHMELFDLSMGTPGSGDWHLVAPTADGGFYAWPVDSPGTHDPQPGVKIQGGLSTAYFGHGPGEAYGNDVALGANPGAPTKWVVFDYSKELGRIEIGFYNWNLSLWTDDPVVWDDPDGIEGFVWDLSTHGNWLLAGAERGFLVIDMATMSHKDQVYIDAGQVAAGKNFDRVHGIEMIEDANGNFRIFASLGYKVPGVGEGFGVAMYGFDPVNGIVVDSSGTQTDSPLQALFDGHAGDDFPGPHLGEGGRLSVAEVGGMTPATRLYVASSNGNVVELDYDGTLTPMAYWNNGNYFEEIMDCNAYVVQQMLLSDGTMVPHDPEIHVVVAKRAETFEIIRGTGY